MSQASDHYESPDPNSLAETAVQALIKSGHSRLQRILVAVEGRAIVLRGTVPSYYLKQLAQVTVLSIPGVEMVRNELEVRSGKL